MTEQRDPILRLRTDDLTWRELDGEVVVLDAQSSTYFSTNRAGGLMWKRLIDGCTGADLARELVRTFEIDSDQADEDVARFVKAMYEHGLIV